jgi:hypothetical protein
MTPFYANKGFHPLFDGLGTPSLSLPPAETFATKMNTDLENLKANLAEAISSYSENANRLRKATPSLNIGDLVFLNRKDYKTLRPSRKLDDKYLGPFKIVEKINPVTFRLKLPDSMKIHPVFHVSVKKIWVSGTVPIDGISTVGADFEKP